MRNKIEQAIFNFEQQCSSYANKEKRKIYYFGKPSDRGEE